MILSFFSVFYVDFLPFGTGFSDSYLYSFMTNRKFRLETEISSLLAAAAADFCSTRASLSTLIAADLLDLTEVVEFILALL